MNYEYKTQILFIGENMNKKEIKSEMLKHFPYFDNCDPERCCDPLTEVFNRETINKYMKYLIGEGKPFCLFLVDVDNFKYINDGYGHKAGDMILTAVAQFLIETLGTRGVVGRYGGDEFVMVCEGITEYNDVWKVGHDINMSIGNLRVPDLDTPSITITMGVSRFPLDTTDFDELWNLSDKALYRGKTKGRNCFIIYLQSKHQNLELHGKRDMMFSPMYLHAKVFNTLTETKNLSQAIKNQMLFLVSYLMYDHMCIETSSGMKFRIIHSLSKYKDFKPVIYNELANVVDNTGLVHISKVSSLSGSVSDKFMRGLGEQCIVSTLYCSIDAFGKTYGYIRIDMTDTVRIWQNDEMNLIVTTAKAIGLLLHYNKTNIDKLDFGGVEIVGKE